MSSLFQEIQTFFISIIDWIVLVIVFTFFFFTCNVERVTIFGHTTLLPLPSEPSFAASFFLMLVHDVAPEHIPLIVTDPLTAFAVQAKLALLLAIFFTLPVFLFRFISYLAPALHTRELRIIYALLIPLTILFFGGVWFAYIYVAPSTLSLLYTMTGPIGVTPMLGVSEFIGMTTALLFTTGFAFTIPVFMVVLTILGAVPASFWRTNARFAIIFFLVVSAIITPDGSGISMLILSFPVSFLYGAGALVCSRVENTRKREVFSTSLVNK